jgi:hypothetical protein
MEQDTYQGLEEAVDNEPYDVDDLIAPREISDQLLDAVKEQIPAILKDTTVFEDCRIDFNGGSEYLIVPPAAQNPVGDNCLAAKINIQTEQARYLELEGQASPLTNETVTELSDTEARKRYLDRGDDAYTTIGMFRAALSNLFQSINLSQTF